MQKPVNLRGPNKTFLYIQLLGKANINKSQLTIKTPYGTEQVLNGEYQTTLFAALFTYLKYKNELPIAIVLGESQTHPDSGELLNTKEYLQLVKEDIKIALKRDELNREEYDLLNDALTHTLTFHYHRNITGAELTITLGDLISTFLSKQKDITLQKIVISQSRGPKDMLFNVFYAVQILKSTLQNKEPIFLETCGQQNIFKEARSIFRIIDSSFSYLNQLAIALAEVKLNGNINYFLQALLTYKIFDPEESPVFCNLCGLKLSNNKLKRLRNLHLQDIPHAKILYETHKATLLVSQLGHINSILRKITSTNIPSDTGKIFQTILQEFINSTKDLESHWEINEEKGKSITVSNLDKVKNHLSAILNLIKFWADRNELLKATLTITELVTSTLALGVAASQKMEISPEQILFEGKKGANKKVKDESQNTLKWLIKTIINRKRSSKQKEAISREKLPCLSIQDCPHPITTSKEAPLVSFVENYLEQREKLCKLYYHLKKELRNTLAHAGFTKSQIQYRQQSIRKKRNELIELIKLLHEEIGSIKPRSDCHIVELTESE